MNTDIPFVSVIIPTYNSERTLEKCLNSIVLQDYPKDKIEVIIVDNFSTDKTEIIAKKFYARFFKHSSKRSEAKNFGEMKAIGVCLFFLDSDIELNTKIIRECVNEIKKGYSAVIIPELFEGVGFWAKCKAIERQCYLGDNNIEAAWFFKREVFNNAGGYDLQLEAGEDWDLSERISESGYRISRCESFMKHDIGAVKFFDLIKKKYYYGKTLIFYIGKQKKSTFKKIPFLRYAFIKNWKLLLLNPKHTGGMILIKFTETLVVGMAITQLIISKKLEKWQLSFNWIIML